MPSTDLDAAIAEYHAAIVGVVSGDAEPLLRLYSGHDDVTLANPWGPPARGPDRVAEAMRAAAAHYRDGCSTGLEHISSVRTPLLAYLVEIEHYAVDVDDGERRTDVAIRATTIFRLDEDRWRVAHRHADPLPAA